MKDENLEEAKQQIRDIRGRGAWLATCSGRAWSIMDPRPEDVFLEDIIGGLSRTCRWSGQLREEVEFYSVAEHSSVMTNYAIGAGIVRTREDALAILLHDAPESPLVDNPTPVKDEVPQLRVMEKAAGDAIYIAFDCTDETVSISHASIKELDKRIRIDERQQIIADPAKEFGLEESWSQDPGLEPLGVRLACYTPFAAMRDFAETYIYILENLPRVGSGADPALEQGLRIAAKYMPDRPLQPHTAPAMEHDDMPSL